MGNLDACAASIDQWGVRLQAGEALPQGEDGLLGLLRRASRHGVALLPTLTVLKAEAAAARAFVRRRRGIERLATFRVALATCFAGAGRAWLTAGDLLPKSGADAAALGGAAFVAVTFQLLVRRHLPKGWFWDVGLSPDASLWLRALLGERVAPPGVMAELERLRGDELRRGVCRAAARHAILADFAARRREADADALARIEAAWPVAELFGVGLPVLLILVGGIPEL